MEDEFEKVSGKTGVNGKIFKGKSYSEKKYLDEVEHPSLGHDATSCCIWWSWFFTSIAVEPVPVSLEPLVPRLGNSVPFECLHRLSPLPFPPPPQAWLHFYYLSQFHPMLPSHFLPVPKKPEDKNVLQESDVLLSGRSVFSDMIFWFFTDLCL